MWSCSPVFTKVFDTLSSVDVVNFDIEFSNFNSDCVSKMIILSAEDEEQCQNV